MGLSLVLGLFGAPANVPVGALATAASHIWQVVLVLGGRLRRCRFRCSVCNDSEGTHPEPAQPFDLGVSAGNRFGMRDVRAQQGSGKKGFLKQGVRV